MTELDGTPLGVLCAKAMERLSEQFEDAYIRTAMLIVEVDVENDPDTDILVFCSEDRSWAQFAFIEEGVRALEREMDVERD